MAVRGRSRGSGRNEAAAPFEVAVGRERCRERFVRVRRPMFDRVFLRGDCVVALPRRGTKTASAVAFELGSGREVDIATLPAEGAGSGDGVRLEYLSSLIGRGPSQLRLFAGSAPVVYRSWKQIVQRAEGCAPTANAETRLLRELSTYLRGLMTMQKQARSTWARTHV